MHPEHSELEVCAICGKWPFEVGRRDNVLNDEQHFSENANECAKQLFNDLAVFAMCNHDVADWHRRLD